MANLITNNNEIIFDDIFNKINTNVTQAVKETLTPFISKMKEEKSIYQEIVSVMKKMPEFKKIINENEVLLKERDYLLKFGVVKKADPIVEPIAEPIASANEVETITEPIIEPISETITENLAESISVEPIELVVENIEKSDELLVIVSEEKMPIVIKKEKIENVLPQQKQNKQTITLEITNHHETISNIEEDNLDDKIKQIYLDANLLDSQPQSGNASEAHSEAHSEAQSETASEAEAEDLEDLAELAEQLNDAQSEAEEAQSEAEEAQSEAEEAQSEAEEEANEADDDDEVEEESANEVASEVASDSDSEPEEVFIVDIKDKGQFYTTNEQNGDIYEILVDSNDDIGEKIGKFKDGKAILF